MLGLPLSIVILDKRAVRFYSGGVWAEFPIRQVPAVGDTDEPGSVAPDAELHEAAK